MVAFQFSLQKALDMRARAEDTARDELFTSQREVSNQTSRLARLIEQHDHAIAHFASGDFNATLFVNHSHYLTSLRQRVLAQQEIVQRWRQREEADRKTLLQAARQRQVLERLKQQRYEQHVMEQTRREEKHLQEAGTMAHIRKGTDPWS